MVFDSYVDPCKEFKAEFNVFPPFVLIVTIVPVSTVFIKPTGCFEEDEWYITFSLSVDVVGLKFF